MMETSSTLAPKVIYLASCLLTNQAFSAVEDPETQRSENLTQDDLKTMRTMKKLRTDSYAYLVKADRLLSEYRKK